MLLTYTLTHAAYFSLNQCRVTSKREHVLPNRRENFCCLRVTGNRPGTLALELEGAGGGLVWCVDLELVARSGPLSDRA